MTQQGDVLLYQGNDDGNITIENGLVSMSGGLETAAYLSLFGGNEQDDGRDGNPLSWWGNLIETDHPERQYRSETQYLLRSIPAVPSNLRRIEDAAARDLAWLITSKVANAFEIEATMPGLNKVRISVSITADGNPSEFVYIENWRADAA